MIDYEIYTGDKRKAFVVFKNLKLTKEQMISAANHYFKKKASDLVCKPGYITKDDELFIDSQYKKGTTVVWVVFKK